MCFPTFATKMPPFSSFANAGIDIDVVRKGRESLTMRRDVRASRPGEGLERLSEQFVSKEDISELTQVLRF